MIVGTNFLGIDHVQVASPAKQEEKARQFYTGKLGFTEISKPDNLAQNGGVWFQVGSQQLHIGVEHDFTSAKKAHPAFLVDDAIAVRKMLEAQDVDIVFGEPLDGANRFYVYGPFGNRIEIIEWL